MADTPGRTTDNQRATVDTDAGGGVTPPKPLTVTYSGLDGQIDRVFKTHSKSGRALDAKELRAFLEGQGEKHLDDDGFRAWIKRSFNPTAVDKLLSDKDGIDRAEFGAYLISSANDVVRTIPEDETRPLNEYYISSSHNTYLVGHQLYGASTVEGYRNVLLRGCRSVEIDVWDGDSGEPAVFHGYTLTKEVPFRDVCRAIGHNAFVTSDLPVIVSLEVHAGHTQQEKIVKIMKEEWSNYLVTERLSENISDKELPSPHALRRRILVKVKYLPPDGAPAPAPSETPTIKKEHDPDTSSSDSSEDEEMREAAAAASKTKPKKSKVIRGLADLGVYISSHSFKDWEEASRLPPNHIFSFSEKAFAKMNEASHDAMFAHNVRFLMRVYPFGLRFGSSNLDPTVFWSRGVQLVALNWQKVDRGMMLNEAMFAHTGGYVLKPPGRRDIKLTGVRARDEKRDVILRVTVLAGQALPLPEDEAEDEEERLEKTRSKEEKAKRKSHSRSGSQISIPGAGETAERKTTLEAGLAAAHITATAVTPPAEADPKDTERKRDKIKGFFSRMKHRDGAEGYEPYVDIKLLADGLPEEGIKGKTKALRGQDVVWEERGALGIGSTDPPEIVLKANGIVPAASFALFLVKDKEFGTDDLGGWACVRLDRLQEGYRFIRLFDLHGRLSDNGCLFVRIKKEVTDEWVPVEEA
ncbi:phosphatidylinositol-specific phospholipase C [Ceratobasidium sp. AG-Ba]|nr:phosphatidylinositol-specific phospholipase C [Ceratobasidium sp. AG-Ba]